MWTRLFSLVLAAGFIWVAMEVYSKGTADAFGGALSWLGSGNRAQGGASTLDRIEGAASGARDRQLSRIEGQLGDDPSVGLQSRDSLRLED